MVLKEYSVPKVVGLIASLVTILACFVAAVTWISINMANNTVSIETLKQAQLRHEILIGKNAEIIGQHAQLLAILDQHEDNLKILTEFMTLGGRFTEQDGKKLHEELETVKERLQHYEVLETELAWIKKSIQDIEQELRRSFLQLNQQLKKNGGD